MTLATTYLGDLSRVRVAMTAIPAGCTYAKVERSIDGITWKVVRGGDTVPVVSNAATLDDYEFIPNKINTYRASYVNPSLLPSFDAVGTAATGNNASVVPAHPAGLAVGHVKLIFASIRNSGAGTVDTPAGWTKIAESGNMALFSRTHQGGDVAPTITFTGGVANADTMAQMARFHDCEAFVSSPAVALLNGSAQNIAGPTITIDGGGHILYLGWKQDDMTSSANPMFSTKIADVSTTTGDDASMCWFTIPAPAGNHGVSFNQWPVVITGGAAAISRGMVVQMPVPAFVQRDTQTITPAPVDVWLKNPQRPALNMVITVTGIGDVTRPARSAAVDIVGRTLPVGIVDVQGSRSLVLTITVPDLAAYTNLDVLLSTGEPLLIQPPSDLCDVPSMYVILGDIRGYRNSKRARRRYFDLPVTEVATPAGSVAGSTITWNDVVATYATWDALVAAKADWTTLVGSVSTAVVIVP